MKVVVIAEKKITFAETEVLCNFFNSAHARFTQARLPSGNRFVGNTCNIA